MNSNSSFRPTFGGNRPVVPIFSRKKRPRQALYADPTSNFDNFFDKDGDELMANSPIPSTKNSNQMTKKACINNWRNGFERDPPQSKQTDDSKNFAQMEPPIYTPRPANYSKMKATSGFEGKISNSGLYKFCPKTYTKSGKLQNNQENVQLAAMTGKETYSYGQGGAGNPTYRKAAFQPPQGDRLQQSMKSPQYAKKPPGQAISPNPLSSNVKGFGNNGFLKVNTPTLVNTPNTQNQPALVKRGPDRTQRVITATVQGIHHWNVYREQIPMLFELFGSLDSAVSPNQQGTCKNFVIKDKTGSIRCAFWEMDYQLPHLTRGQVHRCIGQVDRKTKMLYCVSIRAAQPQEQRQVYGKIAAADKAMKEAIATLKEM